MATTQTYVSVPHLEISDVTTNGGVSLRNPSSGVNTTLVFTSGSLGSLVYRLRLQHAVAIGGGVPTASSFIHVFISPTSVSDVMELYSEYPVPTVEGNDVEVNFTTDHIPGLSLPSGYAIRVGVSGVNPSVDTYSCTVEGADY